MAATRVDKVQVEVEIGGEKVKNTIGDLEKAYKQLNRERKHMTVGTEEYIRKTEALKDVKSRLKEVGNEVNGIDDANKGALQSFLQLTGMDGKVAALSSTIKGTGGNVLSMAKSFTTLRGAIIGTGFGALIILLGSLISYFTTTQEGIDRVTAVTRPLTAIFERLKGVVQELGGKTFKGLATAVKEPQKALDGLVSFIKDQVMARFEAIGLAGRAIMKIIKGDWEDGLKDLGNAGIQYTTGMRDGIDKISNAAKETSKWVKEGVDAGAKLDKLQKEIERDEINAKKRRQELMLLAKQQNFIVEDETKSFNERREAAQKALAAQEQMDLINLNLMDKKIEKIKLEQSLNDTSRENEMELAELEAERAEKAAAIVEMRTTTRNKLNQLNKAESAETKKHIDEEAKLREDMRKRELEAEQALQELRIALMADGLPKLEAQLNLEYDRKLAALQGNEAQITEQRLLLEQERQLRLEAVQDEWAEKEKVKQQERWAKRMEENKLAEEMELLELEEKYARAIESEQAYEDAKFEVQREALLQRLEMQAELHGTESIEYQRVLTELARMDKAHLDQKLDQEKKHQEHLGKLREAGHKGAVDMLQLGIELLSQDEDSRKKHAKKIKALAIAQIGINLLDEVQGIWKNANQLPPYIGIPLGIIQTGLAVARGGAAIGKVNSTKYAKGGILGGSRHSQGGNPVIDSRTGEVIAELEAGEPHMILSRNTYANNRGIVDMLLYNSQYRQGAPIFESGGVLNPYKAAASAAASGGSQMNPAAGAPAPDPYMPMILAELQRLNAITSAWPTVVKAAVYLNELEAAQDEKAQVISDAQVK
ncbi:chromosome segregation ATPase [Flammeovirgaceae bacterium 311]|nr:chromosome segregation ATPase [Flammeovirgaceae bacterium 311]